MEYHAYLKIRMAHILLLRAWIIGNNNIYSVTMFSILNYVFSQ